MEAERVLETLTSVGLCPSSIGLEDDTYYTRRDNQEYFIEKSEKRYKLIEKPWIDIFTAISSLSDLSFNIELYSVSNDMPISSIYNKHWLEFHNPSKEPNYAQVVKNKYQSGSSRFIYLPMLNGIAIRISCSFIEDEFLTFVKEENGVRYYTCEKIQKLYLDKMSKSAKK